MRGRVLVSGGPDYYCPNQITIWGKQ